MGRLSRVWALFLARMKLARRKILLFPQKLPLCKQKRTEGPEEAQEGALSCYNFSLGFVSERFQGSGFGTALVDSS